MQNISLMHSMFRYKKIILCILIHNVQTSSSPDNDNAPASASALKPGCNEDLAEADQSRSESSGNQQVNYCYINTKEFLCEI